MKPRIRIGTRKSPLAQAQTHLVYQQLTEAHPDVAFEKVLITTSGDQWALQTSSQASEGKGMFIKELEQALLDLHIDMAVHSLKDMPVELTPRLVLAAIPPRANAGDVLITKHALSDWSELPEASIIGSGSRRRTCQLHELRPDLSFHDIRGNIDTRLQKLRESVTWTAIVLAAAGLDRLCPAVDGLHVLPIVPVLPAPGQGAIALQCRANDGFSIDVARSCHCPSTAACVTAERSFLGGLGGGCQAPTGAHATITGETLNLKGVHYVDHQTTGRRSQVSGPIGDAGHLGHRLAQQILKNSHPTLV